MKKIVIITTSVVVGALAVGGLVLYFKNKNSEE